MFCFKVTKIASTFCDLHRDTSRTFEKLARKLWKWTKDNAEKLKAEDERIAKELEKLRSRYVA